MAETEVQQSNSRRIAKNALMLYIRMFLSMIVGLYTSRVVLNTLGVEDYGIYGVVGGVVSMMGFLNASMSGATSRFITFELGKGNTQRLKDTFSSAMIVHIGIAVVVFIVAETIGLWFLNNKLVIPENRIYAAHWVYQLSIFSAMLGITQVPYNACIIAHERMGIYAYIEILNVSLKLLIVYLLLIGNFDKLILYAILTLAVSVIVIMTYRIYCIKNFSECHFHWIWDKKILKPLLSFSGWDLYGNACFTVRHQGLTFLINIFFGVALNAASSIASTVNGIVLNLSNSLIQAFRPQIIKYYAINDIEQMQKLMNNAVIYTTLFIGCISIPIIFEANYLFKLWLGEVPNSAIIFCQIILTSSIFSINSSITNIVIHATGNIKFLSIVTGSIFLINVPIVYLIFRYGFSSYWAYIIQLIFSPIILLTNLFISKRLIPTFSIKWILMKLFLGIMILLFTAYIIYVLTTIIDESFSRLCISSLLSLSIIGSITYFYIIDSSTRIYINSKLAQIFRFHA